MEKKDFHIRDHDGDLSKRWCIYFYHDGKRIVHWISSKIDTRQERYKEAEKIISSLIIDFSKKPDVKKPKKVYVIKVLKEAMENKKSYFSIRSINSYSREVHYFCEFLTKHNLSELEISEVTTAHAQQYLNERYLKREKVSGKTVNTAAEYLRSLFNDINRIHPHTNPFLCVKKLPEKEPEVMVWEDNYKTRIAEYIRENDPSMMVVVLLVYHAFIRPIEITKIQIKHISKDGYIIINSKIGKSNRNKYPSMSKQLADILLPLIDQYPPDFYLVSSKLKPGKNRIHRNTISAKFREIRDALNIPEEYKLYSFKHTGNTEMMEKVDIDELKSQNGHHSIAMTEKYIKRLKRKSNPKFVNFSNPL